MTVYVNVTILRKYSGNVRACASSRYQAVSLLPRGLGTRLSDDVSSLINPGEYEPVLPTTEEHTAAEFTEDKETDNEEPRRLTPVYTYGSIS